MKDLYRILGITPEASETEIKQAFKKMALINHPDRGGDKDMMGLINEAYQILSDSIKRSQYDTDWSAFQEADIDADHAVMLAGYLEAGNILPYSYSFREQHKKSVIQYRLTPLISIPLTTESFQSGIYHLVGYRGKDTYFDNIFTFIREKAAHYDECRLKPPSEPLTLIIAVKIGMDFLSGNYYGIGFIKIREYLASEIMKIKLQTHIPTELQLYEGIFEIILMADKLPEEQKDLLLAIKKITDYAKKAPDLSLPCIIPLFYNKFFRNLYNYSLHIYWNSREDLFCSENLTQFNGYTEAKEFLNELKERLSSSSDTKNLSKFIRYVKLLFNFEKDAHELSGIEQTAEECREQAFHLLDWVPAFMGQSSRQILTNIFLQIGIKFQLASQLETRRTIKMADERLALKLYQTALVIASHATPDVEIYANTQVIKYISDFQYKDLVLNELIPALKKKTLTLTDVFPFFETYQSNIALLRQENKMIHLMRQLLKAMVLINEHNKSHSDSILIDHSAITILYQAYEACLKNWYQEEYDPATEHKFRIDLMEELLFDNAWSFLDVEQQIDSPWIMVDRDEEGWMKPVRSLPYVEEEGISTYRTINGAEINHKTGEINFFMTPWSKDRPIYEKVFTLYDLQEMLEKNISGAIFSLDPVDPYKPFHPFNLMRFAPSQLFESELLHTMLLTDYVLKFLTTDQEVQGRYPFEQRPVISMIKHLPEYLRKIIKDFHAESHSGALHRFWIEAEEINLSLPDEARDHDDITRIGLGELKMIVKKHRMERDIHGDLKDVGNEDEGWPIYVLTSEQMLELKRGTRIIEKHAMIFIHAEAQLFYWENNDIIKSHVPEDYRETLIRLFKQPKNDDGKLTQNTKNMPLIYRVTKEMAHQSGLSHRYSAEFIFAHEFTTHYDEFAQYLPEFGRLKELSKMSALIHYLNIIRSSNQKEIQAIDFLLGEGTSPAPDTDTYKTYKINYQRACDKITSAFSDWRGVLASSVLQRKWYEKLNQIKSDMGTLTFSTTSTEVNEACQRWYAQLSRDNPMASYSRIWDEVINPKKSEIATELSESKRNQWRSQLIDVFSSRLLPSLGRYELSRVINFFMEGSITLLADALVNQERASEQLEINKLFPDSPTSTITLALDDGGDAAAMRIATEVVRSRFREQKKPKDALAAGFVGINLGKHEEPIDLKGRCLWVPASVRHEVKKDSSGLSRYSFFVYGGVRVQPRINIVASRSGPLRGSSAGSVAFSTVNAQAAMNQKMRALEGAQKGAVKVQDLGDGRIRYYAAERLSRTSGPTRGASVVTEHNTKTGQVRGWYECYDHSGNVNRIHPKMIDGQNVRGQHYPPTKTEVELFFSNPRRTK